MSNCSTNLVAFIIQVLSTSMSSLPRPADGDQSQSAAIVGMVIGGLTLSIVSVALRMISRKLLTNSVDWDDWTIVAAVVI